MIPALAFNDSRSTSTDEVNLLGDHLEAVLPKVMEFSKAYKGERFASKASAITMNGLIITTTSHTGTYLERKDSLNLDLIIPIEGHIEAEIDDFSAEVIGGLTALLRNSERYSSKSVGNTVVIRLDTGRLEATSASMRAGKSKPLAKTCSRLLPVEVGAMSFFNLFRILLNQIDCANGDPKILEKLGFDDRVYRLTAGLISPNLLLSSDSTDGRRCKARSEIESLSGYLRANLTQAISLTQMEQMSGLSIRDLRYAFKREFGTGPIEWVRKQRLHAARVVLLKSTESTTVGFVAYDFCFASSSEFSHYYQLEFGELPEQTIGERYA